MPIGPNGERLPYPGPAMGGGPGPDIPMGPPGGMPMGPPPVGPGGMGPGMGAGPDLPPMPPPDLAAGAAPDMKEAIVGRLQELEQEKAQLISALQNMEQVGLGMEQGPPGLLA